MSISGTCELICDRPKAEDLWDGSYQKWLPEGPADPSLILVQVSVERAEYWDAPSTTWPLEAGFAALPADKREDSKYHAKIDMQEEEGPLIIGTSPCPSCSTDHVRCSHRSSPAALGLGESTYRAAQDLHRRLNGQRDTVEDHWHRAKLEQAIAEVRNYLVGAI